MIRPRLTSRARTLLLASLLLLAGCLSDDQWSFPATRSVLDGSIGFKDSPATPTYPVMNRPQHMEAAAILVALPVVIDVVLLPVTLPRDLYHWLWLDAL